MIRAPSILALTAVVLLSVTLLACGGDDNDGSEATSTPTTQAAVATATSAAPTATTAAAAPTTTTAAPAATATTAPPAPTATTAAAPTATTAPQGGGTTQVNIVDFGYGPENLSGRVGQAMTLAVTNGGQAPHTFTIQGLTDTGTMSAGQSRTVTFTPTAAGTLTFLCTIHGAGVMSGTLTVAP